jgi:hypothetical protein
MAGGGIDVVPPQTKNPDPSNISLLRAKNGLDNGVSIPVEKYPFCRSKKVPPSGEDGLQFQPAG